MLERNPIDLVLQAEILRLLSRLLRRPSPSMKDDLERLALIYADEQEAQDALKPMGEALEAEDLTPLLVDYTQLFVGAFEMTAPPYASLYLEPSRVVGGKITRDVASCYRAWGLERGPHEKLPADFIGYLLDFLYHQAFYYLRDHDEQRLESANRFYERYVAPWRNDFFNAVESHAKTNFYAALGRFGQHCFPIE